MGYTKLQRIRFVFNFSKTVCTDQFVILQLLSHTYNLVLEKIIFAKTYNLFKNQFLFIFTSLFFYTVNKTLN